MKKTPGRGFIAKTYIDTLKEGLIPDYDSSTQIFQQDNALIHIAKATQDWFKEASISLIEWPPYSLDLNPIEAVWFLLKKQLYKLYPQICQMGQSKLDWSIFHNAIQHAWESIPQEKIDSLILSFPRRIKAVKKAKGYYTKYQCN